ncbi:MAG: glycosyltransferase family 39 protein, partial [Bacteroidetes bacterium]|nr:glycosyltransferase family 39 protein [Bacteroidota bacterium]
MKLTVLRYNILIAGAALLLFVPFLGAVHLFDWDEINFAECAREMLVTGDYFSVKINFQPFWEKPPLFIWIQALSMNIFGINEFAARLPNALAGCLTLLVFFNIGRKLVDEKFGLIWALVYAGSFLPHFYFKSGIIDPWFNLFIFSGIYYFILFSNNNSQVNINNKGTKLLLLSA